jgi:hypothetical protein
VDKELPSRFRVSSIHHRFATCKKRWGKFEIYRAVLAATDPERLLYLAVPRRVYEGLLTEAFGQLIITNLKLRLLVFDEQQEEVVKWIS